MGRNVSLLLGAKDTAWPEGGGGQSFWLRLEASILGSCLVAFVGNNHCHWFGVFLYFFNVSSEEYFGIPMYLQIYMHIMLNQRRLPFWGLKNQQFHKIQHNMYVYRNTIFLMFIYF